MDKPLVTQTASPAAAPARSRAEIIAILFNERSGPQLMSDIVDGKHAFVQYEAWETVDEQGRPAWLLLVGCETANADQILELVGSRLPDYIQARRFPPSLIPKVRASGKRLS